MTHALLAFALLALQPPAPPAAPSITLPATITITDSGLSIDATAVNADDVLWQVPAGVKQWPPPKYLNLPLGSFCGIVSQQGAYTLTAIPAKAVLQADGKTWKAVFGPASTTTVTYGTPGPGPGPGPNPGPPSALVQAIQTAYTTDKATDPNAATELPGIAKVYTYLASTAGIGNVTTVTDWSQVTALAEQQATANGVSGKLIATQTAVAQAFVAGVPAAASGSGPIAAADRAAATAFFAQAAAACGQVTR